MSAPKSTTTPRKPRASKPSAGPVAAPAAKTKKLSPLLELAREIALELGGESRRVKVSELAAAVVASGRHNLKGKTPAATVGAHIYVAAKKGVGFVKVEGERGLVEVLEVVDAPVEPPPVVEGEHDPNVLPGSKTVRKGA